MATFNVIPGGGGDSTTIAGGIALLSPGDTLLIHSGTYNERISSGTIPSGSSGSPTIIAVNSGDTVTLFPTSQSATPVINMGAAASYITFQNLIVDGSNVINGESSVSVGSDANVHHIRFVNVEVKNTGASRLDLQVGAGFLVGGILNNFVGCNSHDNGKKPGVVAPEAPYGFYISGSNNIVEFCQIHHNGGYGIQQYHTTGGSDNNILRNNAIYENGSESGQVIGGIVMGSGTGNVAYNNIIWSTINKNNLIGIDIINSGGTNYVYNNTVTGFQYFGITTNEGVGTSGTIARGNLAVGNGTNLQISGSGSSEDHNVTTGALTTHFLNGGSTGDFRLLAGSSAIDAGADLSAVFNTDVSGTIRSVPFDAGAYEFGSAEAVVGTGAGDSGDTGDTGTGGTGGDSTGTGVGGGVIPGGGTGPSGPVGGPGGGGSFLREDNYHLDLVMDASRSQWDWVTSILSVFNSAPIYSNGKYKIISDRADLPLRQVFHAGNTMPGKTEIRIGGNPIKPNQINVQFADSTIHYTENVVIIQDSASIFAARDPIKTFDISLRGITRHTEAIREGSYLLLKNQRTKREVTFSTGLEGLAVEPGDRCKVGVLMTDYQAGYGGRALDGSSSHIVFDLPVSVLSGFSYELLVWHTEADTLEQRNLANSPGSGWIVGSPNLGFSYPVQPGDRWAIGITSEDLFDLRVAKVERDPSGIQTITGEQFAPVYPDLVCVDSHTPVSSLFAPPANPRSFSAIAFPDCTLCVSFFPAQVVTGSITKPGTAYPVTSGTINGFDVSATVSGSWSPFDGAIVGDTMRFLTGAASAQARKVAAWYPGSNGFDGPRLIWWSPALNPAPNSGDTFVIEPRSNQAVGMRVYWPPINNFNTHFIDSTWRQLGNFTGLTGCVDISNTVASLTIALVGVSSWGVPNLSAPTIFNIQAPGCDNRDFLTRPSTVFDTTQHLIYGVVLPGSAMGLRNVLELTGALFLTECCSPSGESTLLSFGTQFGSFTVINSLVVTLNEAANVPTLTTSGGRLPATLTLEIDELGNTAQQQVTLTYDGPSANSGDIVFSKTTVASVDTTISQSLGITAIFSHPDSHNCFNLVPDNFQMVITEVDT